MPEQLIETIAQTPWILAALAALAVGGAHYATHMFAGEEWAFDQAGVQQAGMAVLVVTFGVVWVAVGGDPIGLVRERPAVAVAVVAVAALLAERFDLFGEDDDD